MGDEEPLLERLARAIAPGLLEPSGAEVQAVRRAAMFLRERLVNRSSRAEPHFGANDDRIVPLPPLVLRAVTTTVTRRAALSGQRRHVGIHFLP
jgi:hypothetical protein